MSHNDIQLNQRVSYSEKKKNEFELIKNTLDEYISKTNMETEDCDELQELYDIYDNNFSEEFIKKHFASVTNPFSTKDKEFSSYPSKLRLWNIIRPSLDLYQGEYNSKPFNWQVTTIGEDGYNRLLEDRNNVLLENWKQQLINQLNNNKFDTGMESQEIPQTTAVLKQFHSSYRDKRAMKAQKLLKIMMKRLHLKRKFKELFKHWVVGGRCFTRKSILHNDIQYHVYAPDSVSYESSNNTPFIEDRMWACSSEKYQVSDIVDMFYDELSQDQYKEIYHKKAEHFGSPDLLSKYLKAEHGSHVILHHCAYKSQKRIRYIQSTNEVGQIVEDIVDEDYQLANGEKFIGYDWVNEVWEGYRIGADMHLGIAPYDVQRNDPDNPSICKLPYNGVVFEDEKTAKKFNSVTKMGTPYLILYITIMYKLEMFIRKSKGKILLLDKNTVPDGSEDSFFYFSEAKGYAMINRDAMGVDKSWNQYQVVDMSLFKDISEMVNLLEFIQNKWDDLLGITRQRKGQTKASDLSSVNQEAIIRSTIMSDTIFSGFEDFIQTELQSLLDHAKIAYSGGIKSIEFLDEPYSELFNLEPMELAYENLRVYVTNSSREYETLEKIKSFAQSFVQNEVGVGLITDILSADSITEVKILAKLAEEKITQLSMREGEADKELESMKEKFQFDFAAYQSALNIGEIDAKYDREEVLKSIINGNDSDKSDSNRLDSVKEYFIKLKELQVKENDSIRKERIAKENKNKYDNK